MTSAIPDLDTQLIEELWPTCDCLKDKWDPVSDTKCGQPAKWIGTKSCCGSTSLICDPHKQWWQDWYASGRRSRCQSCKGIAYAWSNIERL